MTALEEQSCTTLFRSTKPMARPDDLIKLDALNWAVILAMSLPKGLATGLVKISIY